MKAACLSCLVRADFERDIDKVFNLARWKVISFQVKIFQEDLSSSLGF